MAVGVWVAYCTFGRPYEGDMERRKNTAIYRRKSHRLTCTVTDFLRNLGRAITWAILVTMSHNLLAKIEYLSLVMRHLAAARDKTDLLPSSPARQRSTNREQADLLASVRRL